MSKQDYRTPPEFIDAVRRRFGPPGWDLAASHGDEIDLVAGYFTPETDSLAQCWRRLPSVCAVAWLNPPFRNIRPWVRKLDEECQYLRRWTLLLVPASMGSGWWREHVMGKCMVFGIPRLTFVGETAAYPKDLALCAYGYGVHGTGYWDWRSTLAESRELERTGT